jgi:chitodextrinase
MTSYTGLADGTYTFKVRARNRAGEVDPTPAERTFTVDTSGGGEDTTPPETLIIDGPEGTVSTSDVYFEWTGTDNVDQPEDLVFSWRLSGGSWSDYNSGTSTTLTGLADDTYTFEVRARDTSGNVDPTPASRTFTVDTTGDDTVPPETMITSGPSGTIDYNNVTFTFTGSDDQDSTADLVYSHQLTSGAWSSGWSGYSGSTTANYNGLADAPFTFHVRARDTSGNVDPSPATRSFTVVTGGDEGVEIVTETTTVTGPAGEFLTIHGYVINHQDVTDTFDYWAVADLPPNWAGGTYCVHGVCVPPGFDLTGTLGPGEQTDLIIDFDTTGANPGESGTIHLFVRSQSNPAIRDDVLFTCTVN